MEPFYGHKIDPTLQKEGVKKILSKYIQEPVSKNLKKRICDELIDAQAKEKSPSPSKL